MISFRFCLWIKRPQKLMKLAGGTDWNPTSEEIWSTNILSRHKIKKKCLEPCQMHGFVFKFVSISKRKWIYQKLKLKSLWKVGGQEFAERCQQKPVLWIHFGGKEKSRMLLLEINHSVVVGINVIWESYLRIGHLRFIVDATHSSV